MCKLILSSHFFIIKSSHSRIIFCPYSYLLVCLEFTSYASYIFIKGIPRYNALYLDYFYVNYYENMDYFYCINKPILFLIQEKLIF